MSEVLTSKEAAAYLKTSPETLKRLARYGHLPGMKLGHTWRFRKADLDELFTESVVDRSLVEEAERRLTAAADDGFVEWDEVKAKAEDLP